MGGPLIQHAWCLSRKRRGHTATRREDSHVKMEAKVGGMQPQAKVCIRLPETSRGWEGALKMLL